MLHFNNLEKIYKLLSYSQKKLKLQEVFAVGGVVRDLLLGHISVITDLDLTGKADPERLFNQIDKENLSIFRTQKFGTITLVPHEADRCTYLGQEYQNESVKIEITPFRQETGYQDFRHPDTIVWSDSLFEDSKRRDFTINCLYYSFVENTALKGQHERKYEDLINVLDKQKLCYLEDSNVLIIQDEEVIKNLFVEGKIDSTFLAGLEKNLHVCKDGWNRNSYLGIIVDPHWGIQDLLSKTIKCVGIAEMRFNEDALRILRGVRFANILNQKIDYSNSSTDPLDIISNEVASFDFDSKTWKAMKKSYFLVQFLAKERIKEEVCKVFSANNPFWAIALYDELNILKYIFPYLAMTKHNDQPVRYHPFDTFSHIILTLYHLQQINTSYLVKLGMLYHDVAKPDQYYYAGLGLSDEERQKVHASYISHPIQGEDFSIKDFKALQFSNKEIEEIKMYVRWHHLPWEILMASKNNIEKKIRKAIAELGYDIFQNLIDISIGDRLGQYNPLQQPQITWLQALKKLTQHIFENQWAFSMKELCINWERVMKHFNISAGKEVWVLLKKAFDRVVEDPENRNNEKTVFAFLRQQTTGNRFTRDSGQQEKDDRE